MSSDAGLIMIVDDEATFRHRFADHFKGLGYRVLEAGDGEEALALFDPRSQDVDLVVTDIRMPRMDGETLIGELRERRPYLPIIGVTGQTSHLNRLALLDEGAYYYLYKPIPDWPVVDVLVANAIRVHRAEEELLALLRNPDLVDLEIPGLLGPDGRPLTRGSEPEQRLVTDFTYVSRSLLSRLREDPDQLHKITPREFEELVAELLRRQGYEVELTPPSKDGGVDIYAAIKQEMGSFLYVVECKHYSPHRPVGVGLVRQLWGVVQAERATAGILVSSTHFTRGAKEYQKLFKHQLTLRDYHDLRRWLEDLR